MPESESRFIFSRVTPNKSAAPYFNLLASTVPLDRSTAHVGSGMLEWARASHVLRATPRTYWISLSMPQGTNWQQPVLTLQLKFIASPMKSVSLLWKVFFC
jgi:hypothetical protein